MTLRLTSSNEDFTSAEWTPTGETILQVNGVEEGNPLIEVEARVDAEAQWSSLTTWQPRSEAFKRLAQFPELRLNLRDNVLGEAITVYDNE